MGQYSDQVHQARTLHYRSAKAFWTAKHPACSYQQYILIEKGTDLPSPTLAAQIAKSLELDLRSAMYAWAGDSMPSDELRDLFRRTEDAPLPDASEIKALTPSSPPLVINRMQATLLLDKPMLYEVLSYMATYSIRRKRFPAREIANVFGMTINQAKKSLNELYQYGLIDKADDEHYSSKSTITIPQEEDLEELQFQVFRRAIDAFEAATSAGKRPIRATLTRLLTDEQYAAVAHRFRALRNWVWALPELNTDDAKPHTIAIFGSERRFK